MLNSQQIKGYFLAFAATVAGSTVYIFSKAAFAEVSLPQFGMYWFGMAVIWNLIFILYTNDFKQLRGFSIKKAQTLSLIGLIEIIATSTLFLAIIKANDASVPSFLRNMEYVFITIMGVILLREKFVKIELVGILLTFTGVFVISYTKGLTIAAYITGVSGLMLISSVSFALRTIIAKKNILSFSPALLAVNRSFFLFAVSLIFLLVLKQSFIIPKAALINITIGSFLGPFITSICQFSFLKYIEASRGAIIQSTTGLFVLTLSYLYLGSLPLPYQITGGIITIIGAIVLIFGSRFKYLKFLQKNGND